jgi:hypothetical protein
VLSVLQFEMDDAKEQHVYGKFCVKLKKSFENNAIS